MFNYQPFSPEDAFPPAEVRFTEVHTEPWPDGRRVRVHVTITPFQQRPNLEVRILNAEEEEAAHISIIETMENKMVFTMHIRGPIGPEAFRLEARLSYEDLGVVDERSLEFITSEAPQQDA
jgi:hypothetical protein